jgi:acyl dehydratase
MPFAHPVNDRYFDDYIEGDVHELGTFSIEQDDMLAFARRFDPQDFHADPVAAERTIFRGLIASGWHTAGLMMRLYWQEYLTHVASLASPGIDELRWPAPVRPGDVLAVRVTIQSARVSKSKPDRGIVQSFVEVFNQRGETVMTLKPVNIIARRPGTY